MSNDLNLCQFIGNLGRNPEMRFTQSGTAICNFPIACGWKSKDKEGTEWVNITAFGKLAEICGEYLIKGKQIYISGRMTTDKYEKDGITRYRTKVIADRMRMLGGGDSGSQSGNDSPARQAPQQSPQQAVNDGFEDSEIPF